MPATTPKDDWLLAPHELELAPELGYLGLEFRAQRLQRRDVLLQAADFLDLGGDLRFVDFDGLLRFRQLAAQLLVLPAQARHRGLEVVAEGDGNLQFLRQLGNVLAEIVAGAPLQRQQVGQLAHLVLQPDQRLVAPAERLAQEELRQHEHHQQEHDDHQERRERVDEPRPDVGGALPAVGKGGHCPGQSCASVRCRRRRRRSCGQAA